MKKYQIIGLNSAEQAERIKGRFCDALTDSTSIIIDAKHSTIELPDNIEPNIISLISSFEQVSIVSPDLIIEHLGENTGHHHEHVIGEGKHAQKNMLIVFFLNLFFSIGEFIFGTLFKSQAILSDAVHDLGDALSIGLAYFFEKISNRESSNQYSYGYRRFSLLGAFVTSVVLISGSILVIINTIPLLINPRPINQDGVFWVAIGAILINGFSVWLLSKGQSANEKLLNIHLFEDLFGWIAVLTMSILLKYTDWYILDPILSILIAGWILIVTSPEFIRISKIFLQAVPEDINVELLRTTILSTEHVQAISHFHIWSTDGNQHMMSLTVTTNTDSLSIHEAIKLAIREILLEDNISHITIEILYDPNQIIKESIHCEG